MRLGNWVQALGKSMPWLVLSLAFQPAQGQFRELDAEGASGPAVEIQLHPTHEPFVPPRLEPVPSGEPTPATPMQAPAAEGTPTPADRAGTAPATTDALPSAAVPAEAPEGATRVSAPAANVSAAAPVQPAQLFSAFRRSDGGTSADAPTPATHTAPMNFNQVIPGESLVSQVRLQWGEPIKIIEEGSSKILIYRAPGFRQIDLIADEGGQTVKSIQVHLAESLDIEQVGQYLGLAEMRPVEITDGRDTPLGRGYPERGVLLSYDTEANDSKIAHIALEPIGGELFRLRAEHDDQRRYAAELADLERAIALNPQDGRAHWLQAEVCALVGRNEDAWNSIQAAQRIEPSNPLYHLTRARLAAGNGDLTEALLFTKNVAQDKSTPSVVRARAEYQWGNLLALGADPDPQEALTHHLKAIDLAAKSAADRQTDVRRMAKDILIDAHLAVAQDIALGNFQRQREVVPKWLSRATELAEEFISGDAGDATARMEIYRTTLAVYSVLEGNFDTSIATDEALSEGRRLIAESNDRLYQCRVERELSETLYHAARIEHRCGRLDLALKYANNSIVLLEANVANAQPSRFDGLMNGQLYFLTGSIYALKDGDHHEAVKWFDKALPGFGDEQLGNLVDTSTFGDLYVSMGVSYWESGDRTKGVELTQQGADLMQAGVQTGTLELAALSIPYGNLAAMHQQLGDDERAKHFATMLAKVEGETETTKR
jgi:tetratricopeptide (TPR) repeat protein